MPNNFSNIKEDICQTVFIWKIVGMSANKEMIRERYKESSGKMPVKLGYRSSKHARQVTLDGITTCYKS